MGISVDGLWCRVKGLGIGDERLRVGFVVYGSWFSYHYSRFKAEGLFRC
jgi:hypothetical protein